MKVNLYQFGKYVTIGLTSILIDVLLLSFLLDHTYLHYLIAATITFTIASIFHYTLNHQLNYKKTARFFAAGLSYFLIVAIIGLVSTLALISLLVEIAQFHPLNARLIAAPIVGIINYILNTKITFKGNVFA